MATHYNNHAAFASADFLPLPSTTHWEQSVRLPDGKILMAGIDRDAGAFMLARHLKSGALDETFGDAGIQRIAADVARDVTHLSLELQADGRLMLEGTLGDRFSARNGSCLLWIRPTTAAWVHLGVDAFLSISRSPLASELLVRPGADCPASMTQ
ncbi:hypothetical protein [Pseudomonas putida]|uniref:Uncharacterized protein n=1 Tax=Pseudomonas putida TaxID=303 RepID=A0A177S9L3_PSEPU|nr:hypothetical protein [Pseudomonas putida]OAI84643.1 hypothetical protein AYO28_26510 [Pseudomonas putida]